MQIKQIKFLAGANIHLTTIQGDSALYLATFGVLSSADPDIRVLEDLITAGKKDIVDSLVENFSNFFSLSNSNLS